MTKQKFQSPKGVKDILPEDQKYLQRIYEVFSNITLRYGFERLDLPIFEETALYQRGVGETTDIVEKEMYTFLDRSETSMTLRPEFTAGVLRSFVQHGMASLTKPVKLWSTGPIFRYERPQAGRYRQFHQLNAEALGELDPALDLEIMSIAWDLYDELNFKGLSFQINSIGCPECRPGYLETLKAYYKKHMDIICEDCKNRIDRNPLRLLDCKNETCQTIIQNAPMINEHLCEACEDHFAKVKLYLDTLNRPYTINPRLVRGLDYYTKTVFEVWAEGIGSQNAVCGGGRYDGLVELLGGQPTPGVGFAAGIERMVFAMQQQQIKVPELEKPDIYFVSIPEAKLQIIEWIQTLRSQKTPALMALGDRSFKAQFREANKRNVKTVIVIGDEELKTRTATVKDMQTSEQEQVPFASLITHLNKAND